MTVQRGQLVLEENDASHSLAVYREFVDGPLPRFVCKNAKIKCHQYFYVGQSSNSYYSEHVEPEILGTFTFNMDTSARLSISSSSLRCNIFIKFSQRSQKKISTRDLGLSVRIPHGTISSHKADQYEINSGNQTEGDN